MISPLVVAPQQNKQLQTHNNIVCVKLSIINIIVLLLTDSLKG